MRNPFKKDNHVALIGAIVIGTVAAGAIAFLFLTELGNDTRRSLKKKIKSIAKDAATDAISKTTKIKKKVVNAAANHVVK
jgi:gas vesicle protein